MAGQRKLEVVITGDTRGITGAFNDVDGHASRLKSGLASFGKVAAVGLAAAGVGAVAFGKSMVDAAVESQKVTKQTEAVLKSMGGQANITAEQVANLSTKLSMQSGVDDELIQSGENVLLTFGKVRNEVGKGNDIFNRATQSALDMSVALGTDMQSATMMLGKALNDPIKGMTALTRSGVSFTEQQKEQVKAMVKAGDTLGAQKLIMGEMEKQFGGSAAAQATAGDKLKVAFGNLQEQLGTALLPIVEKVATALAEHLPAAMAFVETASARISEFVKTNWPAIRDAIVGAVQAVQSVVTPIIQALQALWENFGNNILSFVQRVWPAIQQVIEAAMNIIHGVIQVVTALIQGDWSAVWEGIKQIFFGVWEAIQGIVRTAMEVIRTVIGVALEVVGSVVKGAFNGIVDVVKGLPGRITSAAAGMWDGLKSGLQRVINGIITGLEWMVNRVVDAINAAINAADVIAGPFVNFGEVGHVKLPRVVLHEGGIVPGLPGSDVPALLQAGEGVFTRDQMSALGGLVAGRVGGGERVVNINIDARGSIGLDEDGLVQAVRIGFERLNMRCGFLGGP